MQSEFVRRALAQTDVVGCAVGVLRGEAAPEFFFHGECERGGGETVASDVLWEAASLTKPVVGLLAAERAVEDEALLTGGLATDLSDLGADDDERWAEINLLHLLTHSSGLPNWREPGQPLGFESNPGTAGYSGEGFELLLAELARHADLDAGQLLAQLLVRLQMNESTFTPKADAGPRVAIGHLQSGEAVPKQVWATPMASGSLHTTVQDYMRFVHTIARPDDADDPGTGAAAKRVAERQTEFLPGYGRTMGWAFVAGDQGDVLWQHGANPGFKHVAAVRPSTGEAIVVFTNDERGDILYRQLCMDFLAVEVW